MQFKHFLFKFWYFIWFIALPLIVAWNIVYFLDRADVVEEMEIWYVLLVFAGLAFGTYSIREKIPLWRDLDENSPHNMARRRKEASISAKNIRRIVKKKGHKISPKGITEIEETLSALDKAIETKDDASVTKFIKTLEEKSDRHLAFAKKSAGRELFDSIGVAVLVAVILRLFVVEAFKIPSESMVPTLMVGDHIFVSKYLYGLSLPTQNKRLIRFAKPAHGEVIVFSKPSAQEQGKKQYEMDGESGMVGKDFIKRIVGLPGDVVEMRDDIIYVNNKQLPRCRIGTQTYRSRYKTSEWKDAQGELWVEKHGDYLYTVLEDTGQPNDIEPTTVGEGMVFVLGDNRDNSNDSRYWGQVPFDNIKGRAMFIWWSNRRPYGFHWNRVGNVIMSKTPDLLTGEQEAALKECKNLL